MCFHRGESELPLLSETNLWLKQSQGTAVIGGGSDRRSQKSGWGVGSERNSSPPVYH